MEEVSAGGQTGKAGEAHDHSTVDEGSILYPTAHHMCSEGRLSLRRKALSLHWPRAFHCMALLRNQLYECVFLGTSSLFNPLSSYFVNSC